MLLYVVIELLAERLVPHIAPETAQNGSPYVVLPIVAVKIQAIIRFAAFDIFLISVVELVRRYVFTDCGMYTAELVKNRSLLLLTAHDLRFVR